MQKHNFLFILKSFFTWKLGSLLIAFLAIQFVPLSGINFFGGKYINYITNPLFWGWANFDGEHYLSIAMYGYKDLQLAFFPIYPFLMNIIAKFIGNNTASFLWSGLIISNLFFLGSLVLLWNIIRLDYSEKVAKISIMLLLVFPTSFYFGSVYTESLFLFLSLLVYYLYRQNKYLFAGIVGILLTTTRLYGAFIIAMIFIDVLARKTNIFQIFKQKIYLVGLSALGLLSYMSYCWYVKGDALAFYSLQTNVGEHRSDHLILLPQVFYRYFVKIIPNLSWDYFPVVFTTLLETLVAVLFLSILYFSFKKIRWDYWVYMFLGYLVPTLTGSFSSLPRYVVVLFPAFIFLALKFENVNLYLRLGIYLLLAIIAVMAEILFFRGYFVS